MDHNVKQLYSFLREFNLLKNPTIINYSSYAFFIDLSDLPITKYCKSLYLTGDSNSALVLKVKRPVIENAPTLPEDLKEWVETGYNSLDVEEPRVREQIFVRLDTGLESPKRFDEDATRVQRYNFWKASRQQWYIKNKAHRSAEKLFSSMYSTYTTINSESETYELVLADMLLEMNYGGQQINHPLLIQKVEIEYDDKDNSFEISIEDPKTELYSVLLRNISQLSPKVINDVSTKIYDEKIEITDYSAVSDIKKSIENNLSASLVNEEIPFVISSHPMVFLRRKNMGYARFIENILEDIESNPEKMFPQFILDLIGQGDTSTSSQVESFKSSLDGLDKEVLLTLPANDEQLRIMKLLKSHGAVLVQGPPGTGKTHTIANLMGHLLSEGKSVLVTSQTDKALSVLKNKIIKNDTTDLQSLCISLSKERNQRHEMDQAIDAIGIYQSKFVESEKNEKIKRLETNRSKLLDDLLELKGLYTRLRNLEYKEFIFAGESIKPIDAAKFIAEGKNQYDYLNGDSTNHFSGLPLSHSELEKLYYTNAQLSEEDVKILSKSHSEFESFWSIEKFSDHLKEIDRLKQKSNTTTTIKGVQLESSMKTLEVFESFLLELKNREDRKDFVSFSIKESAVSTLLLEEIHKAKVFCEQYNKYTTYKSKYDIEIDYSALNGELSKELLALCDKGATNAFKGIGGLLPNRKKIQASIKCSLDINKADSLSYIGFVLQYEHDKSLIVERLNKYLAKVSPERVISPNRFEVEITYYEDEIDALTFFNKQILPFLTTNLPNSKKIIQGILQAEDPYDYIHLQISNEISMLEDHCVQAKLTLMENEYQKFSSSIDKYKYYSDNFYTLVEAVKQRDSLSYNEAYSRINAVYAKQQFYKDWIELLGVLEKAAPTWAFEIKAKIDRHANSKAPENIHQAWKYFQLKKQLDELNEENKKNIEDEITKLTQKILVNAQQLAHEKAWLTSQKKQTKAQSQALDEWRILSKKMPKSKTAKKTPIIQNRLRELMPMCQSSIPAWIMPLSHVVDVYDPRLNSFDVIIIDEASQADILALSVLYMGKQVIIVGDDRQVSPEAVGIREDAIKALHDQYLRNIPAKTLFHPETSLYDMAQIAQFRKVVLTEHFRSYPSIISFSNTNFYQGHIQPLRDDSRASLKPILVEYRVANGFRESDRKLNRIEADKTVQLVHTMVSSELYKNKTIGVIAMVGHEQTDYIQMKLQDMIPPQIYQERKILCGTPYQFQGDERDIIFINLVDSSETARLVAADVRDGQHAKAYNVAVSRARDQLIVMHSLNVENDLKSEDLRFKLIQHVRNAKFELDAKKLAKAESPFEEEILKTLLERHYKVTPQYPVAGYRIDMVVEGKVGRIALECDGEKYHSEENAEKDYQRQAQLERLGWRFIRIRGSFYYSDKEKAIEYLFSKLSEHKVEPEAFDQQGVEQEDNFSIILRALESGVMIEPIQAELTTKNTQLISDEFVVKTNPITPALNVESKKPNIISEEKPLIQVNKPVEEIANVNSTPSSSIGVRQDIGVRTNDNYYKYFPKEDTTTVIHESILKDVDQDNIVSNVAPESNMLYEMTFYPSFAEMEEISRPVKFGDIFFHEQYGYCKVVATRQHLIDVRFYKSDKLKTFSRDSHLMTLMNRSKLVEAGIIQTKY